MPRFRKLQGIPIDSKKFFQTALNQKLSQVCDDSDDKVDPDTCDGRASWTEWKDQTGCFMYFCDNTGQRLTSQTLC